MEHFLAQNWVKFHIFLLMDLTIKYLGRAGRGRGGVGHLCCLPPSNSQRIFFFLNQGGGQVIWTFFQKETYFFCGMASLRKVFLKKNASFCKIWPWPPPLALPDWRWTNNKTATQIKSLSNFSVNDFHLVKSGVWQFRLLWASFGHHWPFCATSQLFELLQAMFRPFFGNVPHRFHNFPK